MAAPGSSGYCSASSTLLQTLGNRQCPTFTSHLQEPCMPTSWWPAFSTGELPLLPLTYFPQQKVVGTRRSLGSPRPAPENSPPPPTNCNPVAGIQCRSNSISGLLSRQHNLSPGSPPIIGTQICRHRELIGGIKEEVVFGVSCGHSSARAMHYLLWSCCARPADPGLCAQLPAGYTQRGFHPPECHVFN